MQFRCSRIGLRELCLSSFTLAVLSGNLRASPWVITTDFGSRTIHTVDIGAAPPTVYGPFLGPSVVFGQLGAVKVLPDQRTAAIADAFTGFLYFLDVTDPRSPSVASTLNATHTANTGLAVSGDGRYMVASLAAGFSMINLQSFGFTPRFVPYVEPTSVAISPDSSTVLLSDPHNQKLMYGGPNPSLTDFASENFLNTGSPSQRVAIAPDGQTVLVGNMGADLQIFRLTSTGLVAGNPAFLLSVSSALAFVFEPGGNRVYALVPFGNESRIAVLRIDSPGVVSLVNPSALSFPTVGFGAPGADILDITPDGGRLVVGNSLETTLRLVHVADWSISTVDTSARVPAGVAVFAPAVSVSVPAMSPFSVWALAGLLGIVGALKLLR